MNYIDYLIINQQIIFIYFVAQFALHTLPCRVSEHTPHMI